ncbi:MAG: DUF1295 domain-containing protein [Nitrospira sp.]|nr:DUF1295 domain-containing protein [Nitrospira sp.]MCP9442946.1 DUF1295 domain-containing protein [Nitrospira sp.]
MDADKAMIESNPLPLVLEGYFAMMVVMVILWFVQRRIKNAAIAEVGFCLGLISVVAGYTVQTIGGIERTVLTMMLVVLYAGRLGHYLLVNRVIGKEEDTRYQRLRKSWGSSERFNMFLYFQMYAVAVAVFSIPFLVVLWNPRPPTSVVELIGLLIWGVAVAGEARADRQLARFQADPANRGRVCRDGLWRYSRHPNYFFDWLHWWSYVVMTLGASGWAFTLLGPVLMGWLIFKVTGIPPNETDALEKIGEEYRTYRLTTNAFVPGAPKKP